MRKNLIMAVAALLAFAACKKSTLMSDSNSATSGKLIVNDATIYTPSLDDAHNILLNASGYNPKFMTVQEPWEQTTPKNYQLGLVDSKANMIRYPGGTWASYFDYDHDKMFPKLASADPNGWVNTNKINNTSIANNIANDAQKVNSVADLQVAASGGSSGQTVNVVFQMNMITPGWDYYHSIHSNWSAPNPGSSNLNDTWYKMLDDRYARFKRMLLRAKTGAHPIAVQFIELGNEYYFGDDYQVEAFADGGDHGKACNYIADKLKNDADLNLAANVRIAATATCVDGTGTRVSTWNHTLNSTLDKNLVGYVTMHEYHAYVEPNTYNEANFQTKLVSWFKGIDSSFTDSKADAEFIAPTTGTAWRIWYTETNANWEGGDDDTNPVDQRTWAQSLAEAYSAIYLYDRGSAAMYLQFQFNSQVRDNSEMIGSLRLYNRALVLMPFMKATKDATSGSRVSFVGTGIPTLPNSGRGIVGGYCFTTSGGTNKCFFMNLSATSRHLNLGAHIFTSGTNVQVETYNNTSIGSVAVPTLSNNTYAKTDVILLPYSVNYIYQ